MYVTETQETSIVKSEWQVQGRSRASCGGEVSVCAVCLGAVRLRTCVLCRRRSAAPIICELPCRLRSFRELLPMKYSMENHYGRRIRTDAV